MTLSHHLPRLLQHLRRPHLPVAAAVAVAVAAAVAAAVYVLVVVVVCGASLRHRQQLHHERLLGLHFSLVLSGLCPPSCARADNRWPTAACVGAGGEAEAEAVRSGQLTTCRLRAVPAVTYVHRPLRGLRRSPTCSDGLLLVATSVTHSLVVR